MQAQQVSDLVSSRMLLPSISGARMAMREAGDIVRGQQGGVGAEVERRIGQAHDVEDGMRVVTLALDQLDEEAAQQVPPLSALLRPDESIVAVRRRQQERSVPGRQRDAEELLLEVRPGGVVPAQAHPG